MKLLPEFTSMVDESFRGREIRAEILTCQVWLSVILATYGLFVLFLRGAVPVELIRNITYLVLVVGGGFAFVVRKTAGNPEALVDWIGEVQTGFRRCFFIEIVIGALGF